MIPPFSVRTSESTSRSEDASSEYSTSSDISADRDSAPVQPLVGRFPKKTYGTQSRGFQTSWYKQFAFLEYSEQRDLAFCFVCRHFSTKKIKFTTGYPNWLNAQRDFKQHWGAPDHSFCVEKYAAYKASKTSGAVGSQISSQRRENILRNRRVLASSIEVIFLCAMQEIALRAHD